jgi:hypothetical protein
MHIPPAQCPSLRTPTTRTQNGTSVPHCSTRRWTNWPPCPASGGARPCGIALDLVASAKRMKWCGSARPCGGCAKKRYVHCSECCNISDRPVCDICVQPRARPDGMICVVEDIRDVIAIENTRQYKGPVPCVGRGHQSHGRPWAGGIALPPGTLRPAWVAEGISGSGTGPWRHLGRAIPRVFSSTANYKGIVPRVSMIARGISIGGDLEQVDEMPRWAAASCRPQTV